ncbi:hypothetical protein SAMN00120144_2795 [Hymenobacter roseosalivarius DSM 11622]|uniref:Uncharacterized protein n=1 Tax=Hymenobacter roseosalivarius DSM 11622 TaxID=645990 RepID=A0A1W1W386_9BACT|nr:hypothetical protein [Hymenobacter roseosalivarius]SMB99841.1 hypothetical protein SAMN00120144_2795 [Hymenobacter roseosalivarius DSM 11622]
MGHCFYQQLRLSKLTREAVDHHCSTLFDGLHIIYEPGPRKLDYLQAFLAHTGQRLRGWHKLFGDQRLMAPFTPEEGQWIADYLLTAEQRGTATIYGAVLLPQDTFVRLSVSQVMTETRAAALTYHLFDSEAAGQEWLQQVP